MRDRYRLQSLRDAELIAALPHLVQNENEHTADLLAHLAELDERKLYLDLGFRSIWEYCTLGLGFCETSAWRRYTAARVCRRFPELFAKVARGELQLSVLGALAKYLTVENASELFTVCHRQSIRKVEELIAARFPVPDVRDSIRRLPGPSRVGIVVSAASSSVPATASGAGCDFAATTLSATVESRNEAVSVGPEAVSVGREAVSVAGEAVSVERDREATPNLRSISVEGGEGSVRSTPQRVEPLSPDRFGVRFTADAEFLELLEQVRDLASHRTADIDLLTTMKAALAAYRTELLKARFAVGRKPRAVIEDATAKSSAPTVGFARSSVVGESSRAVTSAATRQRPAQRQSVPSSEAGNGSTTPRRAPTAAVTRAVFERDGGRCTFVASDGRRCSGRRRLELDHVEPHAVGGSNASDNLRLRCRAHNQRYAEHCFGRGYMSSVMKRARQQRARSD